MAAVDERKSGKGVKSEPKWKPESEKAESSAEKLLRKSKNEPFVPIGFAGLLAAIGYGIYGYKNRGPMSTSRYLMRLRVIAQSCVVGSILVGVTYAAFNDSSDKKNKK